MISALRGIVALYPNHIWKEDYLLFPMTNKVMNSEEQRLLSGEFEKVDERIGLSQRRRLEAFAEHVATITLTVNGEVDLHTHGINDPGFLRPGRSMSMIGG